MQLSRPIYQLKRRARLLAREAAIPLHEAQDRVAQGEGFTRWSLLCAAWSESTRSPAILPELAPGDMELLAARPRQGKTRIGLQLLVDAVRAGRQGVFFTLEFTERQTLDLLAEMHAGDDLPGIVAEDAIDASTIMAHLADAPRGTLAVIDYLQVLDQRRETPPLQEQVSALREFAKRTGVALAFISQVDRAFDPHLASIPGLEDLRLPNPVPVQLFDRACFTHGGETIVQTIS